MCAVGLDQDGFIEREGALARVPQVFAPVVDAAAAATATTARAMPAAIRPYSMAVAPDSSFMKREMNLDMLDLRVLQADQGSSRSGLLAP